MATSFRPLAPLVPVFLSYVLSFIYLGIYWNNHHHMLHAVEQVTGPMLWANLHLLFWLSLIPFVTGWMGENHFAATPTALYGVVLLMSADRLLDSAAVDHRLAGTRLAPEARHWQWLEGKAVTIALRDGHSGSILVPMDLAGDFRLRCADLACSGSADREGARGREP